MIHSTAVVDASANIDEGVSIGPFSIIGPDVNVGRDTVIGAHVVIVRNTSIGPNNYIYQFCSIGDDPQDKKFSGEADSVLEIGANNCIREFCSINRGTRQGGGITRIGDNNWIMAYVHIAHDCMIGNNNVFANHTTFAGHVVVEDFVTLGGFTGVHQFCRIGSYSFTAISSVVVKDIPPYLLAAGNTARPFGLNSEGLKRHGFDKATITELRRAYRLLYRQGLLLNQAIDELSDTEKQSDQLANLLNFIKASERGIIR